MRALAPVFLVLILLLAAVSAISAQEQIHNPELPQYLVFQWRIETDQVHQSWKNDDFVLTRGSEGLVVFYGEYRSLEEALDGLPELPKSVDKSSLSLVPFFNQRSISAMDALVLLGDRTAADVYGEEEQEIVSFSVYFQTFEQPQGRDLMESIGRELSFEVLPNYHFAYSAGLFDSLDEAEQYAEELQGQGFEHAEVNKFLNGQKVAMVDVQELYAYVKWNNRRNRVISF